MPHLDEGTLQAWRDRPRSGLDAAASEAVRRHLAGCTPCARRFAELEASSRRVEEMLAAPVPPEVGVPAYEAVVARAGRDAFVGRRRRTWVATAWAASVVAALGVGWVANELRRSGDLDRTADAGAGVEAAAEAVDAPAPPAVVADVDARAEPAPTVVAGGGGRAGAETAPPTAVAAGPERAAEPPAAVAAGPEREALPSAAAPAPASPPARPAMPVVPVVPRTERAVDRRELAGGPAGSVVRGRVTDDAGRPLASAIVVAEGTGQGTLTGPDGTFELGLEAPPTDSAARELVLTAQLIGYGTAEQSLTVGGEERVVSADFRLTVEALALDEIVVTGTAGAARRRVDDVPAASTWTTVSPAEAEAAAGFRPLSVPVLPVLSTEIGEIGGVRVVRVTQLLEGGGVLELVQAPAEADVTDPGPRLAPEAFEARQVGGLTRTRVRRGDVQIDASAPLPPGALEALLDRLR